MFGAVTDFLGENIQDQKIKWQLLGNLLPEYAGLVTALTNLDTDENPMNMEELKVRILTEEQMLIHRKVLLNHKPNTPPVTQMPPPTSVYSAVEEKRKKCLACGISNHEEIECWHKHPDKVPPWWKPKKSNTDQRPPERASRDTSQDNKREKKSSARYRDSSPDGDSSSSSSENSEDYKRRKKHKGKDKE